MWRKQKRENKRNAAAQQEGEMIEKNMSYSNYNYPIPPPNPSTWGHSNYMPNY
jgi:hypothetical protein